MLRTFGDRKGESCDVDETQKVDAGIKGERKCRSLVPIRVFVISGLLFPGVGFRAKYRRGDSDEPQVESTT